jgi:beta-N-acetylhexosaminidase
MRASICGLAAVAALSVGGASAPAAPQPTLAQLVGQHVLVRMAGRAPSAALLARVRAGEVGGVILFGDNIGPEGPQRLVASLQAAARAGGQLPLLIAVDQEGGAVRRLPGPPTVPPSAMHTAARARAQGLATGRYLHGLGIGIDLAPVLDVPSSPRAFIAPRAFSSSAAAVASRGVAFAQGLVAGGTAATAKHFPGLGRLAETTDDAPGVVHATRAQLARDLVPFQAAVRAGIPAVMVGTASYPALGSSAPAACAPKIVGGLLRRTLGFKGVVVSDDLATAGVSPTLSPGQAAVRAVQSGVDMVYLAGSTGTRADFMGRLAYASLLSAARNGLIAHSRLAAGYARVAALKRRYG